MVLPFFSFTDKNGSSTPWLKAWEHMHFLKLVWNVVWGLQYRPQVQQPPGRTHRTQKSRSTHSYGLFQKTEWIMVRTGKGRWGRVQGRPGTSPRCWLPGELWSPSNGLWRHACSPASEGAPEPEGAGVDGVSHGACLSIVSSPCRAPAAWAPTITTLNHSLPALVQRPPDHQRQSYFSGRA